MLLPMVGFHHTSDMGRFDDDNFDGRHLEDQLLNFQLVICLSECCTHVRTPLNKANRGDLLNCESVALYYSEKQPSSALRYLPAVVQGFCHSFGHW